MHTALIHVWAYGILRERVCVCKHISSMGCVWESPVLLSLPVTRGRVAWGLEIRGRARTGLGPDPKLCWEIHHLPSSEREVTDWDRELFNSAIYSFRTLALYKMPHDHSFVTGGNISVIPGPIKIISYWVTKLSMLMHASTEGWHVVTLECSTTNLCMFCNILFHKL